MRYIVLAVAWKPLGHFEDTTWHKPTNCRVDHNGISNLEFVRRHRSSPSLGDTAVGHLDSVDVILIGAHVGIAG